MGALCIEDIIIPNACVRPSHLPGSLAIALFYNMGAGLIVTVTMARVVKIDSKGETTPEYSAVRSVATQVSRALKAEERDFVRSIHRARIIPSASLQGDDVMDTVLNEIAREPLIYYTFQHVLNIRNIDDRYTRCIRQMEKKFLGEFYCIRSYIKLPETHSTD